ncbi:hypothetical protein JCM8547_005463 [Rhodosporidiobolus lusitaniae]
MDVYLTQLCLPSSLPFPLTIQRIHAHRNTTVTKTQVLLTYSYIPLKPDDEGNRVRQVRAWESPVVGEVVSWAVREGDVVRDARQAVVSIKEPCTHDVQLHGLCALCGKDLNAVDYTGFSDTSRATISMVHDVGGLTVSREEAHRLETATTTRLLSTKKLSLIVDLDQTIVHATVDPTVGEWLQDPSNPNYSALEGVGKFKLVDEAPSRKKRKTAGGGGRKGKEKEEQEEEEDEEDGCWYYIKMRPGLADFLKRIAKIYEMHVYTMGTRAYAIEVCKVIDPDGGLFGGRILSRDESGSMTRKSLQRLFPCDTNMVVIIDDRADVWDGSPNLIKVIPYEFFVGIGDINAAFLPKKKDLVLPPVSPPAPAPSSPASSSSPDSPSSEGAEGKTTTPTGSPEPEEPPAIKKKEGEEEHPLPTSVASEPTTVSDLIVDSSPSTLIAPSLSEASTLAAATIHDVIEARPLEKARREADEAHHREHEATRHGEKGGSGNGSKSPEAKVGGMEVEVGEEKGNGIGVGAGENGENVEEEEYEEEAVLKDDDRELDRLFEILSTVHSKFFDAHASKGSADVATIIPSLKSLTLRHTHLVFSGLVALGTRPEDSEYWKLARTFGARCSNEVTGSVTHLVANQTGTAKVHAARRKPHIQIVYPQWFLDSVARWKRLPETDYLLIPSPSSPAPEEAVESAPGSPVRPELSDGEGEGGEGEEGMEEFDLDLDWGDAMKEVDDLLDETDDEDTASLLGGSAGNGGGAGGGGEESEASTSAALRPRKRPRMSTPPILSSTSSSSSAGADEAGGKAAVPATESPLQKRVKTARSRRSGLKTSLSAAQAHAAAAAEDERRSGGGGGDGLGDEEAFPASSQASQASSALDSDNEDLLASMAADLENGWS